MIVSATAATTTPVIEPMPPSTTMITRSIDFWKPSSRGLSVVPSSCANSAPPMPAKNAAITNAETLTRVVSTPIASAAISFSRTASSARPLLDSLSR